MHIDDASVTLVNRRLLMSSLLGQATDDPLVLLRRDYYYARALQFLCLFGPAFEPLFVGMHDASPEILIARLEWLLAFEMSEQELLQPFAALAKHLKGWRGPASCLDQIKREYLRREIEPLDVSSFLELSVLERARTLFDLTEWISEQPDAFRLLLAGSGLADGESSWRSDALLSGEADSKGFVYYVLPDARLYRELRKRPGDDSWELLACSQEEWQLFIEKGLGSKNPRDRRLLALLKNELFPDVLPLLEASQREQKRQQRQHQLELVPRKRSSRLQSIKEQDEQRRREQEEERRAALLEKRRISESLPHLEPVSPAKTSRADREERVRQRELKRLTRQGLGDPEEQHADEEVNVEAGDGSSPLRLIIRRSSDGHYNSSFADPGEATALGEDPVNVDGSADEVETRTCDEWTVVEARRDPANVEAQLLLDLVATLSSSQHDEPPREGQ